MATIVQYEEFGGPEVLTLREVPTPHAPEGGVVVAVKAAGVNPIDAKLRANIRPSAPITEPRRVGSDAAGVVTEVGPGVDDRAVGDEVVVRGAYGAYATHLVAAAEQLVRKPAGVTWEAAAAIGVPVSTAYQALRSLGVQEGTVLLIHGGSGSVGRAAIQFAHRWGATVIATASDANHERLRELGAVPVAYGPGLTDRVRAAAPNGVDRVLDAIGTDEALESSFELVADRSHIGTIVVGARAADLGIQAWAGGNPCRSPPNSSRCARSPTRWCSTSWRRASSRSTSGAPSRLRRPPTPTASSRPRTQRANRSSSLDPPARQRKRHTAEEGGRGRDRKGMRGADGAIRTPVPTANPTSAPRLSDASTNRAHGFFRLSELSVNHPRGSAGVSANCAARVARRSPR